MVFSSPRQCVEIDRFIKVVDWKVSSLLFTIKLFYVDRIFEKCFALIQDGWNLINCGLQRDWNIFKISTTIMKLQITIPINEWQKKIFADKGEGGNVKTCFHFTFTALVGKPNPAVTNNSFVNLIWFTKMLLVAYSHFNISELFPICFVCLSEIAIQLKFIST